MTVPHDDHILAIIHNLTRRAHGTNEHNCFPGTLIAVPCEAVSRLSLYRSDSTTERMAFADSLNRLLTNTDIVFNVIDNTAIITPKGSAKARQFLKWYAKHDDGTFVDDKVSLAKYIANNDAYTQYEKQFIHGYLRIDQHFPNDGKMYKVDLFKKINDYYSYDDNIITKEENKIRFNNAVTRFKELGFLTHNTHRITVPHWLMWIDQQIIMRPKVVG